MWTEVFPAVHHACRHWAVFFPFRLSPVCTWWVICHIFIGGSSFICLPICVMCPVAVCFCMCFSLSPSLSPSLWPDIKDGICLWGLICLLRLLLSCILCGCTFQYIRSWQWRQCLSVSRHVCFCVSAKERDADNEERAMASVTRFVCSSSVFCCSVGQWITVSVDLCGLCKRHQHAS